MYAHRAEGTTRGGFSGAAVLVLGGGGDAARRAFTLSATIRPYEASAAEKLAMARVRMNSWAFTKWPAMFVVKRSRAPSSSTSRKNVPHWLKLSSSPVSVRRTSPTKASECHATSGAAAGLRFNKHNSHDYVA